jgi:hypothetical protein
MKSHTFLFCFLSAENHTRIIYLCGSIGEKKIYNILDWFFVLKGCGKHFLLSRKSGNPGRKKIINFYVPLLVNIAEKEIIINLNLPSIYQNLFSGMSKIHCYTTLKYSKLYIVISDPYSLFLS